MISEFGKEFLPVMQNVGDAGYDFICPKDMILVPGKWYDIDTGIRLEDGDIPMDCHIELHPRSGMGFKYGFKLRNTTGIIDAGYRDTIKARVSVEEPNINAILHDKFQYATTKDGKTTLHTEVFENSVEVPLFLLKKGDRFMQGIVIKHCEIAGLAKPESIRNGGLGSTKGMM